MAGFDGFSWWKSSAEVGNSDDGVGGSDDGRRELKFLERKRK